MKEQTESPTPRVFRWCDPEPGPEVTHVRDSDGDVWARTPDGWILIADSDTGEAGVTADWHNVLGFSRCDHGVTDCSAEATT